MSILTYFTEFDHRKTQRFKEVNEIYGIIEALWINEKE